MFKAENQTYLTIALSEGRIHTLHLPANRDLRFCSFTSKCADEQFAYCGYLDITVRQDYYARHGLRLRRPDLPCVEEWTYDGTVTYWPIELLMWLPSPNDYNPY